MQKSRFWKYNLTYCSQTLEDTNITREINAKLVIDIVEEKGKAGNKLIDKKTCLQQ